MSMCFTADHDLCELVMLPGRDACVVSLSDRSGVAEFIPQTPTEVGERRFTHEWGCGGDAVWKVGCLLGSRHVCVTLRFFVVWATSWMYVVHFLFPAT